MRRALGASTFIWHSPFGDQALYLAGHVASLGFDVLEICIEDPGLVTAEAVRRACADAGVGVSVCGAFGPDRDLSSDDAAVRQRALTYMQRCITLAAAVGSPHVAGPMYAATGVTRLIPDSERRAQRARAAESLKVLGESASELGVRLAVEPLNRFETDLVNTAEQALELCDLVGLPNVGLLLDTFHMNIEEKSLPAAIELAGERLFHFQACENDRGAPGSGHVDWDGVLAALDRVGYKGQVVIESFTPTIKEIARAVSIWRPLASSPDALAADGLAFLRKAEAA